MCLNMRYLLDSAHSNLKFKKEVARSYTITIHLILMICQLNGSIPTVRTYMAKTRGLLAVITRAKIEYGITKDWSRLHRKESDLRNLFDAAAVAARSLDAAQMRQISQVLRDNIASECSTVQRHKTDDSNFL